MGLFVRQAQGSLTLVVASVQPAVIPHVFRLRLICFCTVCLCLHQCFSDRIVVHPPVKGRSSSDGKKVCICGQIFPEGSLV